MYKVNLFIALAFAGQLGFTLESLAARNVHVTVSNRGFEIDCAYGKASTSDPRVFLTSLKDAVDML